MRADLQSVIGILLSCWRGIINIPGLLPSLSQLFTSEMATNLTTAFGISVCIYLFFFQIDILL